MRVLNVQLKHVHGGNPQVCLDYSRVLHNAGNEVFVLTNPADPFFNQHEQFAKEVIASKKICNTGSYDIFTIFYFKKLIGRIKPDVIIVHEGRSAALVKRAAGKNIPVIDVNHGRSPKQSGKMDASIVTNSFQTAKYKAMLGDNFPVYYVPNSIDTEKYPAPDLPKAWQELPVIGTIGRLVNDKALDVFIEALAILKDKGAQFEAIMGGEGEEREALQNMLDKYDLNGCVEMPGWFKSPSEFYSQIDIFCFPSRKEEFGLVLLEAYGNGLPAVVSDAEGPSDIAENGVDALVVAKENPQQLADALYELLNDKEKADKLAKAGYAKLVGKYSVSNIAAILQNILEEVVSNHNAKNGRKISA